MARKLTTPVRLDPEDAEALARARAHGHSAARLIREGFGVLRIGERFDEPLVLLP